MITQTFIGPPTAAAPPSITPLALLICGVVMWGFFALILVAVAKHGGIRGLAAVVAYCLPVIGTIMFFAAMTAT